MRTTLTTMRASNSAGTRKVGGFNKNSNGRSGRSGERGGNDIIPSSVHSFNHRGLSRIFFDQLTIDVDLSSIIDSPKSQPHDLIIGTTGTTGIHGCTSTTGTGKCVIHCSRFNFCSIKISVVFTSRCIDIWRPVEV